MEAKLGLSLVNMLLSSENTTSSANLGPGYPPGRYREYRVNSSPSRRTLVARTQELIRDVPVVSIRPTLDGHGAGVSPISRRHLFNSDIFQEVSGDNGCRRGDNC
jgi:hypothetical protein